MSTLPAMVNLQVRLHNVVLGSCTAWVHVMQLLAGMSTVALLPDAAR